MASGTVLLFATIGEIFAERSGVMNLGFEGMMLIGAMSAFSVTSSSGNPWLGLIVGMLAAGLLSQIHAFLTVTLQSDQVVSGLALTFLGTGISLVLGEGLSKAGTIALLPVITIPGLSLIPVIGPILFTNQNILVYVGYLLVPIAWYYINRTRPGLHLRSVGDYPAAADSLGINVASIEQAKVLELEEKAFRELMQLNPRLANKIYDKLIHVMSARIRDLNEQVNYLGNWVLQGRVQSPTL